MRRLSARHAEGEDRSPADVRGEHATRRPPPDSPIGGEDGEPGSRAQRGISCGMKWCRVPVARCGPESMRSRALKIMGRGSSPARPLSRRSDSRFGDGSVEARWCTCLRSEVPGGTLAGSRRSARTSRSSCRLSGSSHGDFRALMWTRGRRLSGGRSHWRCRADSLVRYCRRAVAVVSGSPRMKPRHVDDTLPLPPVRPVQPVLPGPAARRSPVFVDSTGRRAHRLRRWAWVLAALAAAYLVAVASSLLGGPSLPSALLLIDRPSHGSTSQGNGAPVTGGGRASAPAAPPDVLTESVTRPGDSTDPANGRMASHRPGGEVPRSRSGQPESSLHGRSGDTSAADRGVARGRPARAGNGGVGQGSAGRGTAGQKEDQSFSHVGRGRLPDERLRPASRLR